MRSVPAPSNARSIAKYRAKAAFYDDTCGPTSLIRSAAIERLALRPGDRVLDVGCGTGMSFELLRERVGESGAVIGVDQSPEMITLASRRACEAGWDNVQVIEGFMETVDIGEPVDALLFHYTHDILQAPEAVSNLLSMARPGARVSIAGIKHFPWWTGPLVLLSYAKNVGWNGNLSGMRRPWAKIEPHLVGFSHHSTQWGMGYVASARVRGEAGAVPAADAVSAATAATTATTATNTSVAVETTRASQQGASR